MLAYVLATETLRLANKCSGSERFRWQTRTATNAAVQASNGALVYPDTIEWSNEPRADLVLLCAGYQPLMYLTPRVRAYTSRAATTNSVISGVDTGTVILAELGLLDGCQAVLHYEAETEFRERWPDVEVVDRIFCLDGNRLTAAGGTATGDAMLAWISRDIDEDLALNVATGMIHGMPRSGETPQRSTSTADPLLLQMHQVMMDNISHPLSINAVCEHLQLSPKQLRRRCCRVHGLTPSAYYRRCRLEVAHQLLVNSSHSITDISVRCGFDSSASFSRAIRAHFGQPPKMVRKRTFRSRI